MQSFCLRARAAALVAVLALAACTDAPTAPQQPVVPDAPSALFLFGDRPNYLVCPASETQVTTSLVGPVGGLLSLGANAVEFPAGAVDTPTLFSMTVPAGRLMKVDVSAVDVVHYVFDTPVTVTIDYSRCPVDATQGKQLSVWWVSPLLNLPLQNMGGTDDPVNRRITFTTGHFSGYVIAY